MGVWVCVLVDPRSLLLWCCVCPSVVVGCSRFLRSSFLVSHASTGELWFADFVRECWKEGERDEMGIGVVLRLSLSLLSWCCVVVGCPLFHHSSFLVSHEYVEVELYPLVNFSVLLFVRGEKEEGRTRDEREEG